MNRRNFISLLLVVPILSLCWRQQNDLSIDELELLAEERGGVWIDVYLGRIR